MLIEHPHEGDPYSHVGLWLYLDATKDYVASATWREWRNQNTPANGGACYKAMTRIVSAEADTIEEIKEWGEAMRNAGADLISYARTWPIPEHQAPPGHRLHGKRENGFLDVAND